MAPSVRFVTSCVFFLTGALAAGASAQAPGVSLAGGASVAAAGIDTIYQSRYSPAFEGLRSGEAGQRLRFTGRRTHGWWAALTWPPAGRFGFEARVDAGRVAASAESGPYETTLQYQARQPPDYVLRDYAVARSSPWGPVETSLQHVVFSASAVARMNLHGRVRGTVAGGLSLGAMSGRLAPVGYTTFRLGGHAVLFSEEYGVELAFGRTTAIGVHAGGGVEIPLSGRAALVLGGRVTVLREMRMAARVTNRLEFLESFTPLSPAAIERILQPPPLTLQPRWIGVSAGLRIRL